MVHPELSKLLKQLEEMDFAKLSYPYVYSDLVMLKLFVYFRVMGVVAFQAMHQHLQQRPDVLGLVGLRFPPIAPPYPNASRTYPLLCRTYSIR